MNGLAHLNYSKVYFLQVSLSEGRDLAGQFSSATFFEVSVADSPYESVSILEKVVRDIIRMKKVYTLSCLTNKLL